MFFQTAFASGACIGIMLYTDKREVRSLLLLLTCNCEEDSGSLGKLNEQIYRVV